MIIEGYNINRLFDLQNMDYVWFYLFVKRIVLILDYVLIF